MKRSFGFLLTICLLTLAMGCPTPEQDKQTPKPPEATPKVSEATPKATPKPPEATPKAPEIVTPSAGKPTLKPWVLMSTSLGDITLELDAEKAPITVVNFLTYTKEGYFNGTVFHRVMSNFMIQGGGFTPSIDKKTEGLHPGIKNEWRNGLKNKKGTISMARVGGQPDSGTAQFFINVVDNASLDQPQRDGAAYAVFGKIVKGQDTVEKIRFTKVLVHPKYPSNQPVTPVVPVVIKSVTLLDTFDQAAVDAKLGAIKKTEDAQLAKMKEAQRIRAEQALKARKIEAEKTVEAKLAKARQTKDAGMAIVKQNKEALDKLIAKFEKEEGAKFQTLPSGLMYAETKAGTGASCTIYDKPYMNYRGTQLSGKVFASPQSDGPLRGLQLSNLIVGWIEGVPMMKVGGKSILICPPHVAYGIEKNARLGGEILIFELELLGVE